MTWVSCATTSVSVPVLTTALFCLLGCSVRPSRRAAEEPATAARSQHSSARAATDERLESMLAEWVHASDVKNFALRLDQSPPKHFTPFEHRAQSLPQNFDRVVGYIVNFDRGLKHHLGSDTPGCWSAIADDGTLCPSVVVPGVELSASQVAALRELARVPPVPKVSSCASRAKHSFVFYAGRTPVFEWAVNLDCGGGSMSPWLFPKETRVGLERLCRELRLGLCFVGDRPAREVVDRLFAERYLERSSGGAHRLRPFATRVSHDRRLNGLSPGERRELCGWNIQHTITWLAPGGEERTNEAGASSRLLGLHECAQNFPDCSLAVGEILPCMTDAQRGAPVFASFSDANCWNQRRCLWGFELEASSATRARENGAGISAP